MMVLYPPILQIVVETKFISREKTQDVAYGELHLRSNSVLPFSINFKVKLSWNNHLSKVISLAVSILHRVPNRSGTYAPLVKSHCLVLVPPLVKSHVWYFCPTRKESLSVTYAPLVNSHFLKNKICFKNKFKEYSNLETNLRKAHENYSKKHAYCINSDHYNPFIKLYYEDGDRSSDKDGNE